MRILFIDPVCNKPYDLNTLKTEPLGGTEATVIRIAQKLQAMGHQVQVVQHNRQEPTNTDGVTYAGFGTGTAFQPTHVVVLRAPLALKQARKQFTTAKLYFWAHDLFGGEGWTQGFQAMIDTQTVPVLVSPFHQAQMYDFAQRIQFDGAIPSRVIFNPIDDDLQPDNTVVDTNKYVFFSSPHKGLENTLQIFDRFKNFEELKGSKLYIANPGYYKDLDVSKYENVVNLGPLPHSEVINHVRDAQAVLHLNNVFPETFGIVHAESNAVGTPFLSSPFGATPVIADHPHELIDVTKVELVIDRLIVWKKYGRPKVRGNPNFRTSKVIRDWLDLFRL